MAQNNKAARNIQEPVDGTHPAYAVIRTSRVSGAPSLFNSPIDVHDCIRLEIVGAKETTRNDGTKSVEPNHSPIVTIDMSEAQYASMLSSMNLFAGTPCTLSRFNGQRIAEIPPRRDSAMAHEMAEAMRERMDDIVDGLDSAIADLALSIDNGKGKAVMREVLERFKAVARNAHSNIPHLGDVFEEKMAEVVMTAKTEVNSHFAATTTEINRMARIAGIDQSLLRLSTQNPASDEGE